MILQHPSSTLKVLSRLCPCRYLEGEDLLLLCGEVDFPPCLMMRRMLETLVGLSKQVCARHRIYTTHASSSCNATYESVIQQEVPQHGAAQHDTARNELTPPADAVLLSMDPLCRMAAEAYPQSLCSTNSSL
jgi:hypothetical protein